jgi:hypothetical protein
MFLSINWLVFITGTKSVYCAVQAESLTVIHIIFKVQRLYVTVFGDMAVCTSLAAIYRTFGGTSEI